MFFRELLLLTRPQLAQPRLSTADPAGNSVLSSPLGVTVADLQPCSGMRGVSNYRARLAPGVRSLRVLIPAATTSTSAWQAKLFGCAIPTPRRPIARPAVQSMSLAAAGLSRDPVMLLPVVAFACAMQITSHSLLCAAMATQKSRSRVRGFGGVFTFLL